MSTINQKKVLKMYEVVDIGSLELFGGGFINFGYWERLPRTALTSNARIASQKNMYRFVSKKLGITKSDKVLEIGCGKGAGASLIASEFNPFEIHGMDFSAVQIERAKNINKKTLTRFPEKLSFTQGAAENMGFPNNSFNKLISIEALQHFSDLEKFAHEAFRVLKPKGKLAIATFFQTNSGMLSKLKKMIPTFSDKIDYAMPISKFEKMLGDVGFRKIKIEKFGNKVWLGWDKWISQTQYNDHWDRNWLKAYQNGLVDYYIISAEK